MKKVLITGGNGQLGTQFRVLEASFPEYEFTFTDIDELDITSEEKVTAYLSENTFNWLINCAGYTAVDKAESEIDSADRLNTKAPSMLAKVASDNNIRFIHISTDYVFDGSGNSPLNEKMAKNPQSVYGQTKAIGEDLVLANNPKSVIIRTSWLYSAFGNNFVKTIIRLANERESINVVFDQTGTPTWTGDLAKVIMHIIGLENINGIYHFSNEGVCSWYDFAKAITELLHIKCNVQPILASQYPTPAKRPAYSVLDKTLIKNDTGITIPHWRDSLIECLNQFNEQS